MKRHATLALLTCALLSSSAARAQTEDAPPPPAEPPPPVRHVPFGARGQWFFASGISIGVGHYGFDHTATLNTSYGLSLLLGGWL